MKKILFTGCCTALVTPFDKHGNVDFLMLKELIERQISCGVSALLFCGTTGEGSTLSEQEKNDIFKFAVKTVDGRVPVIANVGSNDTAKTIKAAKAAEEAGVDALLVITPYYNKTSQEGLIKHYSFIANSTSLPIIVYNVPSRTGMNITPNTLKELSKINNIVAVKEANTDVSAVIDSADLYLAGNLTLYSGNDDLTLPLMSIGAKGVISVISNAMPREMSNLCELALNGDNSKANEMLHYMLPYIRAAFSDVNPIPIKYIMKKIGLDCGGYRMPLCAPTEKAQQAIDSLNWSD